ncbi:DUF2911 domain-containing protein [Solitalea sp. MAHUQ-68]|uniref:DUF2911 domain-containing protein n=1 Tax=Solitalea agri TaxID=2953739 RepID=A0A9X2JBZ2_9SPHI|nr:DUF2911 domain-containing protein [Solitalea agri]MCO4292987.1 DUF2911 domain-containing protein [Solitalea agri]
MKRISLAIIALAAFASSSFAQTKDSIQVVPIDKSPADIVYYPVRAAFERDVTKSPVARVIYSRPQKNGREIFGKLQDYGTIWRTGANESTEVKFYKDVKIGDKIIAAGEYSLFTIPNKDKWTVILNAVNDKWGAYFYDKSKDVVRVEVPVKTPPAPIEVFTILFKDDNSNGAKMVMGWDNCYVELPIKFQN